MIGLALSGGGVKGSYQIGAFMALKKCGIKFDGFVGTSIGAFNAALLAAGMENELLDFWNNIDVAKILGFDNKYAKKIKLNEKDVEYLFLAIDNFVDILNNKGISIEGLQRLLIDFDLEDKIRNSKIDFGLTTYRLKDFKAIDIFIEDIPKGKLNNYILASCYLPIFKQEKIIDDSYFFDGGIHNYCPVDMLLKKGYEKVYAVDLKAIGIKKKIVDKDKVITISPSRKLSNMISLDQKKIKDNIQMGYYDTIKILKGYDGYKYVFKREVSFYYKLLSKRISNKTLNLAKVYFKTEDTKEIIIKSIEYLLEKNKESYYKIYSLRKVIKKYKNSLDKSVASLIIKEL